MKKGLKELEQSDQAGAAGGGSERGRRFFHVKLLNDQDSCRLRFLTEGDQFIWGWFHRQERVTERGRQFAGWRACRSDMGQPCEDCDGNVPATKQMLAWVFVYYVDHTQPGEKRTQLNAQGGVRYRESVNEVRLFRYSAMHKGGVVLRYSRLGTLLDRDFEWVRSGVKGTTRPTYMLEPVGDPGPIAPDFVKLIPRPLPDLEDVSLGRVTGWDSAGGATAAPVDRVVPVVPVSDLDEGDGPVEEVPLGEDPFAGEGDPYAEI